LTIRDGGTLDGHVIALGDERLSNSASIQLEARQPSLAPSDIVGAEGLAWHELEGEIKRGGRLVVFPLAIARNLGGGLDVTSMLAHRTM